MAYYPPEIIQKVKQMDLLTYLKNYEPYELVKDSNNQYSTKTHGSLKISNGFWNWFSAGIGGKNAVDYLIKVKGYSFIEAVQIILQKQQIHPPIYIEKQEKRKEETLILPQKNIDNYIAKSYLKQRGIDEEIINYCTENRLIYEDKLYHNVIFLGYDENKKPMYAGRRSTDGSRFKSDVTGSNKAYSFKLESKEKTNTIYIFEGAIDLLSYATLFKLYGQNWQDKTMISLAGVYQPAKVIEQSKVPLAIQKYLEKHQEINKIFLCLDSDIAGRNASKALQTLLSKDYEIVDRPPKKCKDYNEYLCEILKKKKLEKIKKLNKERTR